MVEKEVRNVEKGVESNMVAFDFEKTPITQIADYIIITASKSNTSDIHFDPREDGMMVRFRIDGDLQDYTFIPKTYERNLTTRLKLLANMNITESRLPQDGAIKGDFGGKYLDMRVSALPLNEGEKIVIRILDYTRSLQGIDALGFNPSNLVKLKRMMGVPNGIILVTGATGSGKSTTTYSILQGLNKPETNIITVEDPIEMNIEGMNQVQVNAEIGMTFAAALRSILRQDPNVILIGEIRDSETAQIAVRASITGHLVLSTIHTNNSLATIERLLDMDVERYLLSTALTGIISQRLAKQLCKTCRVERETTPYEKKVFKKYMNRDVARIYDADPKGCEHCRKGYKGRVAIQEVLELDEEIRNALNNTKLSKDELADMVYTNKTITMLQDALGKCIAGLTSFEEVYRVIEIEAEPGDDVSASLTKSIDDVEVDTTTPAKKDDKKEDNTKEENKEDAPPVAEQTLPDVVMAKPESKKEPVEKKEEEQKPTEQVLPDIAIKMVQAPEAKKAAPEKQPEQENDMLNKSKYDIEPEHVPEPAISSVMEKEIPELNLKIKGDKAPVTQMKVSPLAQEEKEFEEKDKVLAPDVNIITKATDLGNTEKKLENTPLMPSINNEKPSIGNNQKVVLPVKNPELYKESEKTTTPINQQQPVKVQVPISNVATINTVKLQQATTPTAPKPQQVQPVVTNPTIQNNQAAKPAVIPTITPNEPAKTTVVSQAQTTNAIPQIVTTPTVTPTQPVITNQNINQGN